LRQATCQAPHELIASPFSIDAHFSGDDAEKSGRIAIRALTRSLAEAERSPEPCHGTRRVICRTGEYEDRATLA
jgi:hypothetical protein